MTIEQQKLAAANRIMNESPMIGNEKLVAIQKLLPKHYIVNHSKSKGSIHCKSIIDKGMSDNEWELFKTKAVNVIGNDFLEFFSNTCTNQIDFTIYVKN